MRVSTFRMIGDDPGQSKPGTENSQETHGTWTSLEFETTIPHRTEDPDMMLFTVSRAKSLFSLLILLFLLPWWRPDTRSAGLLLAQHNKVALTFDDLPALGPFGFWRPREISNIVLRVLDRNGIQAAGFVVEEKIDEDLSTYVVLQDWLSHGHTLGNQTYSDVDLNQLSAEDFLQHVVDGQKYLRRAARGLRVNYRYLRYPYLHQGDTESKKKAVSRALYNGSYETAHVTVKTTDYLFNAPYLENEDDPETLEHLKAIYLDHIARSLDYAERQSQRVFERNIPHILWLHLGLATAHFLEDVITLLKRRDYEIIPFQDALSDPAYQTEDTYVGPLGLTFIDRIAASRHLPFDPEQGELSVTEIEARLHGNW